jgi:uncharacterized integral membrane protein
MKSLDTFSVLFRAALILLTFLLFLMQAEGTAVYKFSSESLSLHVVLMLCAILAFLKNSVCNIFTAQPDS